jgi:hypothetical protein
MSDREPDLVIRASSFSEIFDCSERWAAKHLEGMWMPSGAPAVIGTGVHAGTATFDTQRMLGIEPSTDEAVEAAAESVRNPKDEVNWDDVRPGEAIDIATRLTLNYCLDISPKFTYRKVEAKLKAFNVTASNGIVISFTGHVDRQYVENDLYGTLDFKTGKQVVAADGTVKVSLSAAQLGTYELLDIMAAKTEDQKPLLPAMIVAMPTGGKQRSLRSINRAYCLSVMKITKD